LTGDDTKRDVRTPLDALHELTEAITKNATAVVIDEHGNLRGHRRRFD
jgi:hypothetical protein